MSIDGRTGHDEGVDRHVCLAQAVSSDVARRFQAIREQDQVATVFRTPTGIAECTSHNAVESSAVAARHQTDPLPQVPENVLEFLGSTLCGDSNQDPGFTK
jgi:hypothetical protein